MAGEIIQSDFQVSKAPVPYSAHKGGVVVLRATHAFTTTQEQTGDIVEMLPIPVGMRPVDMILDSDDLDNGGTAALLDVGIMSGEYGDTAQDRTIGAEFFSGSTVAQAGGAVRPTLKTAYRVAASQTVRGIGIKINTAPGTPAAGTVGLTVFFAPE
jgi:hypothetical protein